MDENKNASSSLPPLPPPSLAPFLPQVLRFCMPATSPSAKMAEPKQTTSGFTRLVGISVSSATACGFNSYHNVVVVHHFSVSYRERPTRGSVPIIGLRNHGHGICLTFLHEAKVRVKSTM